MYHIPAACFGQWWLGGGGGGACQQRDSHPAKHLKDPLDLDLVPCGVYRAPVHKCNRSIGMLTPDFVIVVG